jgi:hypothetical protein
MGPELVRNGKSDPRRDAPHERKARQRHGVRISVRPGRVRDGNECEFVQCKPHSSFWNLFLAYGMLMHIC